MQHAALDFSGWLVYFFAVVNYGFGSPKKDGLIDNISVRICTVKCSDFHSFHTNSCKRTLNVKKRI